MIFLKKPRQAQLFQRRSRQRRITPPVLPPTQVFIVAGTGTRIVFAKKPRQLRQAIRKRQSALFPQRPLVTIIGGASTRVIFLKKPHRPRPRANRCATFAFSASPALGGIQVTAALGAPSPSAIPALAGIAATASVASLATMLDALPTLSGSRANTAAGTLAASVAPTLVGATATGGVGALALSYPATATVSGAAATLALGTVSPAYAAEIAGVAIASQLGALTPSVTVSLGGLSQSLALGSFAYRVGAQPSGIAAQFTAGATLGSETVSLAGFSISSAVGLAVADVRVSLSGRAISSGIATLGFAPLGLSGLPFTLVPGGPIAQVSLSLGGLPIVSSTGTENITISKSLVGLSSAYALGALSDSGSANVPTSGLLMSTDVGVASTSTILSLVGLPLALGLGLLPPASGKPLAGLSATAYPGSLLFGTVASLLGLPASFGAGAFGFELDKAAQLAGTPIHSVIGTLSRSETLGLVPLAAQFSVGVPVTSITPARLTGGLIAGTAGSFLFTTSKTVSASFAASLGNVGSAIVAIGPAFDPAVATATPGSLAMGMASNLASLSALFTARPLVTADEPGTLAGFSISSLATGFTFGEVISLPTVSLRFTTAPLVVYEITPELQGVSFAASVADLTAEYVYFDTGFSLLLSPGSLTFYWSGGASIDGFNMQLELEETTTLVGALRPGRMIQIPIDKATSYARPVFA